MVDLGTVPLLVFLAPGGLTGAVARICHLRMSTLVLATGGTEPNSFLGFRKALDKAYRERFPQSRLILYRNIAIWVTVALWVAGVSLWLITSR